MVIDPGRESPAMRVVDFSESEAVAEQVMSVTAGSVGDHSDIPGMSTSLSAHRRRWSVLVTGALERVPAEKSPAKSGSGQAAASGNGWPECQSNGSAQNATEVCASEIGE